MTETAQQALLRYRYDAVAYVRERFKVEPDAWQAEALTAYCRRDTPRFRISLQACAGPGKSTVLAWIAWHFLSCWGDHDEHPKGACVSESRDNLEGNLWPELAKWRQRDPFLEAAFEQTAGRIRARMHPETWFLDARSWPKSANPDEQGKTLSGCHGPYTLFLIDESGSIPVEVLQAAEQSLSETTKIHGRIIQAGNPRSRDGMLYAAATKLRTDWHVICITGDPDDPRRSPRVDITNARKNIALWGRDSGWIKYSLLGQFPDADFNALLSIEQIETAMRRAPRPDEYSWAPKLLSADVGRQGDDPSALCRRQGVMVWPFEQFMGLDGPQGAGIMASRSQEWGGADAMFIDATGGWGSSWIDALRQIGQNPLGVEYAGKASNPKFGNKRAENWWTMAERIKDSWALPKDDELVKELLAATYFYKGDRIFIVDKEQMKADMKGHSPNKADALSQTVSVPIQPRAGLVSPLGVAMMSAQYANTKYDPHARG